MASDVDLPVGGAQYKPLDTTPRNERALSLTEPSWGDPNVLIYVSS